MLMFIRNLFVIDIKFKMMLYEYWKDRRAEKSGNGKQKEYVLLNSNLQILRSFSLLPGRGTNMTVTQIFYLRICFILIITSPIFFGCLLHLIHTIKNHIDTDVTGDLSLMGTTMIGSYAVVVFIQKFNDFKNLYNDMCSTENFGVPPDFHVVSKKDDLTSLIYHYYVRYACFIYGVANYLSRGECQRINREKNIHEYCGLYEHAWMPFDLDNPFYFHVFFLTQLNSSIFFFGSGTCICCLFQSCISQVVTRIKHLNSLFEEILMMNIAHNEKHMLLNRCIAYHHKIIELVEEIHITFSMIMLPTITVAGFISACVGYQIMRVPAVGPVLHITGWCMIILMICHAGQTLTDQSERMAYTIFASKWYELPPLMRKDLVLVILRSSNKLNVTLPFFGVVSHELFIKIMRIGYMYLNMLYQTNI